ncbi:10486_t:CDS:2 [Rhizophagus irregularis]|nr:10486_t:CDS:2 [Rhizophagus irregularis]
MATYETNVNNNNVYEEDVDNSSETSKDNYSSSASSFVDESKKINFEDNKEVRNLSSSKRKKRNSFISLVRSLSGIFNKDKDNNKRNNTVEKQVRPTSRTSSNSDASKHGHGYIFFSDDDEKPENDTTSKKGTKSRQNSNAENLEKDKSSKKVKRISVNLGKFFENKSSPKPQDIFENSFLEPGETMIKKISSNNNVNNKHESEYNSGSPTTPITPRLIVTPIEPQSAPFEFITHNSNKLEFEDEKEDQVDQNNAFNSIIGSKPYEGKSVPLTISTKNIKPNSITNTIEQQSDSNNTKTLQELEEINKSLNNVKEQLEAKVAEKDVQITKFNSMEHIMQQQIDLSKRMTETMQRLESKVNVQKDEVDGTSVSKMFEETIKRLETKIDRQNDEIINLKSIVGQLSGGSQQLLLTNGDGSRLRITQGENQNLIIAQQGALIQASQSQSPQIYSKGTLVSTLVVNPLYNTITVSASIATSVLYAVYVRPVVGLVSVLRDGISTNYETTD